MPFALTVALVIFSWPCHNIVSFLVTCPVICQLDGVKTGMVRPVHSVKSHDLLFGHFLTGRRLFTNLLKADHGLLKHVWRGGRAGRSQGYTCKPACSPAGLTA